MKVLEGGRFKIKVLEGDRHFITYEGTEPIVLFMLSADEQPRTLTEDLVKQLNLAVDRICISPTPIFEPTPIGGRR